MPKMRLAQARSAYSQDNAGPYCRFALLEWYSPAVESSTACDKNREPAEGEADVCMGVNLLEEFRSR